MDQLTLLLAEHPARISALRENVRDWPESVVDWPCTLPALLVRFHRAGFFGKTCPEHFRQTADEISGASSRRWKNSGMAWRGERLTLNTSEFPSAAVESSLSDILETGDLPQRFFLSPTACAGILRRAKKRGRMLPKPLRAALETAALTITAPKEGFTSLK